MNGFYLVDDKKRYHKEFSHARTGETVYLNKAEPKVYSQMIVHPKNLDKRTRLINAGIGIGSSQETISGSGYRKFLEKINRGKEPIKYGIPFGFDSTISLESFLKEVFG
jgi:hypothetical protein